MYTKHGLKSLYLKLFGTLPGLAIYMPEPWIELKPPKIGKLLWKKRGRLPEGVEVIKEGEVELTPFGKKRVHRVVERRRMAAGAKETSQLLAQMAKNQQVMGIGAIKPLGKIGGRAKRKLLGAEAASEMNRFYLGHKLPPTELGAKL